MGSWYFVHKYKTNIKLNGKNSLEFVYLNINCV